MVTMLTQLINQQHGPKYSRVALGIEQAIREGKLDPGSQLPPQRELAYALGVTLGTVSRGYGEAEKQGLVQGETGRGTFVCKSEDAFSLHALHNMDDRERSSAIHFDLNFPPAEGWPDLGKQLATLANRQGLEEFLAYRPTRGLLSHRRSAAHWISRFGFAPAAEQLSITTGAQHALQTVLVSQMKAGDSLAVEQFTYPGILNLAKLLGIRLVPVAMDGQGMVPEALDTAASQHNLAGVYMMPTMQNPTCVTMPSDRRRQIAAIIRRHNIFLLEDDVYAPLESTAQTPISSSVPENSFYVINVSKSLAPGLRIGFLASPPGTGKSIETAMAASIWMHPPLMAEIAANWLDDGTVQRMTAIKRREAEARTAIIASILPPSSLSTRPGSIHLWLRLPGHWYSDAFAREAAARGVYVIPSDNFTPAQINGQEAVRICIGPPDSRDQVTRGAEILADLLEHRPARETVIM